MKALIVAAHPDDGEAGAAGLILKLKKQGWTLHYVVFAGAGYEKREKLFGEFQDACRLLGVKNQTVQAFPRHLLPQYAEAIRNTLGEIQKKFQPNLILTPSLNDPHQDHSTVALESVRTFRNKESILSFELLRHGSYLFKPNLFVDITDVLKEKIEVLNCYKTQLEKRGTYFNEQVWTALAKMRGAQVGIQHAEAFEVVKIFVGDGSCGLLT